MTVAPTHIRDQDVAAHNSTKGPPMITADAFPEGQTILVAVDQRGVTAPVGATSICKRTMLSGCPRARMHD